MTVKRHTKPTDDDPPRKIKRPKKPYDDRAEINRRNAKKSTGPKTANGLKIACMNSRVHGMTSKTVTPMPWEEPDKLDKRMNDFTGYHRIAGPLDAVLQHRVVSATIQAERVDDYMVALADQAWATAQVDQLYDLVPDVPGAELPVETLVARIPNDVGGAMPALKATHQGRRWLISFISSFGRAIDRAPFGIPPREMMFKLALMLEPNEGKAADAFKFAEVRVKEIESELPPELQDFNETNPNPRAYDEKYQQYFYNAQDPSTRLYKLKTEAKGILHDVERIQLEYLGKLEGEYVARRRKLEIQKRLPERTRKILSALPEDPKTAALVLRYQSERSREFYRAVEAFKSYRRDSGFSLHPGVEEVESEALISPYKEDIPWSAVQRMAFVGDELIDQKLRVAKLLEQAFWGLNRIDLMEGRLPQAFVGQEAESAAFAAAEASKIASAEAAAAGESTPDEAASRNEANRSQSKAAIELTFRQRMRWFYENRSRIESNVELPGYPPANENVRTPSGPDPTPKPPS